MTQNCGFGRTLTLVLCLMVASIFPLTVWSAELLVNGGFETGDFTGWTVLTPLGGSGNFFVLGAPGTGPVSGLPSAGPSSGSFFAMSDQNGPGTNVLLQSFVVPTSATQVILSYDLFVNNASTTTAIGANGLDHTVGVNQHGRVDLLTSTAGALDVGAGVIQNFYIGADPFASNPNPWVTYAFDITGLVTPGGTYQIRFAQTDNQLFFNMGVDNVSIRALDGDPIPEPSTAMLAGLLLAAGAFWRMRAKARG